MNLNRLIVLGILAFFCCKSVVAETTVSPPPGTCVPITGGCNWCPIVELQEDPYSVCIGPWTYPGGTDYSQTAFGNVTPGKLPHMEQSVCQDSCSAVDAACTKGITPGMCQSAYDPSSKSCQISVDGITVTFGVVRIPEASFENYWANEQVNCQTQCNKFLARCKSQVVVTAGSGVGTAIDDTGCPNGQIKCGKYYCYTPGPNVSCNPNGVHTDTTPLNPDPSTTVTSSGTETPAGSGTSCTTPSTVQVSPTALAQAPNGGALLYGWRHARPQSIYYRIDFSGLDEMGILGGASMAAGLQASFQAAIASALAVFENSANLKFIYDPGCPSHSIVFRVQSSYTFNQSNPHPIGGYAANNTFPMVIVVPGSFLTFLQGTGGFVVLLHEIGHTLGLKHPGNGSAYSIPGALEPPPYVPPAEDNRTNTVMSYYGSALTLMQYDINALQFLYGAGSNNIPPTTTSCTYPDGTPAPNTLSSGSQIDWASGYSFLCSQDGKTKAALSYGSFSVFDVSGSSPGNLWTATPTTGYATTLAMQNDCNLVLYRNGQQIPSNAVWATLTGVAGGCSAYVIMQNDRNLVVCRSSDRKVLWSRMFGVVPDPSTGPECSPGGF